jgi:ABC-2 type transport system permease protein
MVKFILRLFRPFRKLIEWAGVDYHQFEVILQAKLTMDNRKMLGNSSQKKTLKNAILLQVFIYGMMGGYMCLLIKGSSALFFFSTIFFSFIMIMVIMGLISEFNTILFDTRDNSILLPRPISPRTLLFVRVMHIMIYLMLISLSLSIIPSIVFAIVFGVPAMLLLMVDVILITVFSVFLTNIIYLLLMKFTTGERLKDIIVYAQIVLAVIFMGAYQLMPRLAENEKLITSFKEVHWWMFLVPPFWMSASLSPMVNGGFGIQSAGFLFLSVAMPLLGLWLVSSVLAKNFNQNLSTLDQGDTRPEKKKGIAETSKLVNFLSRICTYTMEERISFKTIWRIAVRDRKFKQAVYPGLGYVLVIILMAFINGKTPLSEIHMTKKYLVLIYAPSFILYVLVFAVRYSDNFKASWIYQTIPMERPGYLISGAFKAVVVQLFLPVFIIINAITIYVWGFSVLLDVVFGFFAILMTNYAIILMQLPVFPFSDERSAEQSGRNITKTLLMFFTLAAVGGVHFLLVYLKINLLYVLPFVLVTLFLLSRKYRLTPWSKMVTLS